MKIYDVNPTAKRERVFGMNTGDYDCAGGKVYADSLGIFEGETPHIHKESDEIYIIACGKGSIWVKDKIMRLVPGKIIRVEKGDPHFMLRAVKVPFILYSVQVPSVLDKEIIPIPAELAEILVKHEMTTGYSVSKK